MPFFRLLKVSLSWLRLKADQNDEEGWLGRVKHMERKIEEVSVKQEAVAKREREVSEQSAQQRAKELERRMEDIHFDLQAQNVQTAKRLDDMQAQNALTAKEMQAQNAQTAKRIEDITAYILAMQQGLKGST